MNNQPPSNFMDTKTLIALVMLGFAWFGWQAYLQQKYPDAYKPKTQAQPEKGAVATGGEAHQKPAKTTLDPSQSEEKLLKTQESKPTEIVDIPEKQLSYSNGSIEFKMSSKGMAFREFRIKDHYDRNGEPYTFTATPAINLFETRLLGRDKPLDFVVEQVGPKSFVGTSQKGNMVVKKAIEIDSSSYLVKTQVSVENASEDFIGLETVFALKLKEIETSSFLPTFERQEIFSSGSEGEDRVFIDLSNPAKDAIPNVKVASVGTQYFSQSLVDHSKIAPEFRYEVEGDARVAQASLRYSALNKDNFELEYEAFIGPKYLNVMEKIDPALPAVIDFGFFSWLAKPMLELLKVFHNFLGNWGFAIILLTIIIRMVVLPFTMMSYKSMNKMKLIQPKIKALKEKYKDDAQKLNQEMMLLMRDNKVNPLGGCLPMLLQFPVFIALYQVLGQSVELYQAPFMFWINDLSLKDPYYVLPVLMGLTMFVQQKITPNTMDPAQQKVMMFLPLVFVLFMVGLPSGLTLYIFVSSLFAILQQVFFMRDTLATNEIQTA